MNGKGWKGGRRGKRREEENKLTQIPGYATVVQAVTAPQYDRLLAAVPELRGAQGGPAPLVLLRAPLDAMTKWG